MHTRFTRIGGMLLLLLAGTAQSADPPPAPDRLAKLLADEPISRDNWPAWRQRLRDWSGEYYEAAEPAFKQGIAYARMQYENKKEWPKITKAKEDGSILWMLIGAEILLDRSRPPVERARDALAAIQNSIKADNKIARTHYWRGIALRQQELADIKDGGPTKPDAKKLNDALKAFEEARVLDPRLKSLSNGELGEVALAAHNQNAALAYLKRAVEESPGAGWRRLLAQTVAEANIKSDERSRTLKSLMEQDVRDGVVVCWNGAALLKENRPLEAAAEFDRARTLGADPVKIVGADRVQKGTDARTAKTEEERKRAEEARKHAAEVAKQKKEDEQHRAAEAARNKAVEDAFRWWYDTPVALAKTIGWWVLWFTVVYSTIMIIMSVTGWMLAKRTHGSHALNILDQAPEQLIAPGGHVLRARHETMLARLYLLALLSALVLFYFSLPFVFVGLLIVFLLLIVFTLFGRGHDTSDVHGAMLKASGGGIMAVFKAIFARSGTGHFGVQKEQEDCPELYAAVMEVAERVDTDPVDEIWISPGADFYVVQQGRGPFGVFGSRKRVLMLGLCVMHYLSVSELKAILAHEYAHFSHADTFWSRFVFQVSLSLRTAMREMARTGGWVTWVNPFYWFFYLYSKSYNLLSAGFSRSREFLADRMACCIYGGDVFTRGLIKVCTDGALFERTVYGNIVDLLKKKKAFVNMYKAFREFREKAYTDDERRKLYKKLIGDQPSLFASHPTFSERLAAAKTLPLAKQQDQASSLQLFEKPEELERELTDWLTEVVDNYIHN